MMTHHRNDAGSKREEDSLADDSDDGSKQSPPRCNRSPHSCNGEVGPRVGEVFPRGGRAASELAEGGVKVREGPRLKQDIGFKTSLVNRSRIEIPARMWRTQA